MKMERELEMPHFTDPDDDTTALFIQVSQLRHQVMNLAISKHTREHRMEWAHVVLITFAVTGLVMFIRQSVVEAFLPSSPEFFLFFIQRLRIFRW